MASELIQPGTVYLSRAQVREIDRRAIEEYGIPGIVLMENASRAVADVAGEMLSEMESKSVLILCGGGNNGGDGFAAGRHLHNRGVRVRFAVYGDASKLKGDALTNHKIAAAMKLAMVVLTTEVIDAAEEPLLIDALFGTGLSSPARDPFPAVVEAIARRNAPVLSVDVPSGLDCDLGVPLGSTVRATRTVTFVAMKKGFAMEGSREFTGEVTVGEIGCPVELIDAVRREVRP